MTAPLLRNEATTATHALYLSAVDTYRAHVYSPCELAWDMHSAECPDCQHLKEEVDTALAEDLRRSE